MPLVASGQFTITDSADNINMILSSDSFIVATNSDGSNGNYSNCVCRLKVLQGFLDETSKWTFSVGTPVGLTGVLSSDTYTVSGATLDSSTVDITATRSGYPSITKRLTVVKAKAGATGAQGAQGVQGPTVTITANRALSFTSTDGTLNGSQADIVFKAATTGITSPTYAWSFTGLQTNPTASTTTSQTITAAQFGTSNSATVTCTVGTYKETLTIVRLEKSTAAAGATVGATWGTNVGSIPANISTAASSPTVSILNNGITIDAGGTLQGIGSGAGTTVSNALIDIGGTNLLKNSTKASFATSIGGPVTITLESVTLPDGTTGNAIKMVTGAVVGSVRMYNCLRGNDTYSFSTYHRVASGSASTALDVADVGINSIASTTTWRWHKQEGFAVSNYSLGIYNFIDITAPANTTLYFWHPKVEYGNKATDWVPAVEDVDSGIATAATTATWSSVSGTGKPADNATVGATWGTNVSSIPSNISTAGTSPTIDLRNNQIGLNASGQLYGAGAGNGTTVSNAQISVDTATGVIGGIGTGAGTAVANSQVAFSARQTWEFRGSAEGWVAGAATLTANADTITLTATGIDSTLSLGGLNINGSVYDKLRVRIRRVGGSGWDGKVYFATSLTSPNTHNYSEAYCKVLANSLLSTSFVILEWDMANLTVGSNNWTASTITAIRLDLGSTTSDVFEIDWISVGKYGHDVDLVLSASSQIVAGTTTNGVILDAATKSLQVVTGGNERVRLGNQAAAVNGSAYGFVVKDNSGNVVFDSRNAVGIVGNQAHDNYNLGDSSTNPFWNTNTNGVGNVAIGALALCGDGLAEASGRSFNVAIGYQALRYTNVGTNIAIGYQAGRGNPAGFSGGDNTVIGYNAMVNGTTANKNVAIGRGALRDTTSGSENTAVGYLSQSTGDIASYNTSFGYQSIRVATGSENTSVGHNSGYSLNTGGNNTFVGKDAGYTITSGSGNTFIGYKAYTSVNQNNQTIIASGAGVVLKHSDTILETAHNFVSGGNITATGTVKGGAITVEGASPTIYLIDTDAAQSNFWIHANSSKFHVLTDYNYDGSWEAPNPLVLDNATTTANIYGSKAWTAGNDGADSGLDADLLDGVHASSFIRSDTSSTFSGGVLRVDNTAGQDITAAGQINGLQVYQATSGADALMTFHVGGDYALHFGLDGETNDLIVGGWTMGAVKYRIWHAGNDGTGSGLDADTLDGYQTAITATVSTAAVRDGSGDIHTRLIRSEYGNDTSISGALAYRVESTSGGNNYVRFCSDTAAIRTYLGVAASTHSHTVPVSGAWFNGGYMSIRSNGVMNAGKYLDWHNATTDTTATSRTTVDSTGLLTHSEGLKVKGTGGLGYAFGGAVTQLTSRDTGVTLNTPSGTITLFSTTVTAGTMNKFTLTNSCITALDVVVVGVQTSNSGTFNVFVNRTATGVCDIVVQNLVTVATVQAIHINFAIIKGANA